MLSPRNVCKQLLLLLIDLVMVFIFHRKNYWQQTKNKTAKVFSLKLISCPIKKCRNVMKRRKKNNNNLLKKKKSNWNGARNKFHSLIFSCCFWTRRVEVKDRYLRWNQKKIHGKKKLAWTWNPKWKYIMVESVESKIQTAEAIHFCR